MNIGTLTGQIAIEDQVSSALTLIAGRVKRFAEGFDDSLGGVAIVVGAAVTGVVALTAAITALGNRGSDVNDVANTLDRFAGSAENATEILAKMQEGTLGTVTKFDMMKSSAKLLAADVKLSAADFGTLSSAAFVLQNQGLGPTKQMLDMVSSALLTGRTRSIEMAIGKMDLTHAETKYAASLNKSEQDLNAVEKLEAKRIGILEELGKKVKAAGVQHRDFGEQLEFAVTSIKNWFDQLASIVASSPKVNQAIESILTAFQKAFGGESQSLMQAVASGIDWVAEVVIDLSTLIVPLADGLRSIYSVLEDYIPLLRAVAAGVVAYTIAWGFFTMGAPLVKGIMGAFTLLTGGAITLNASLGVIGLLAAGIWSAYEAYRYFNPSVEENTVAVDLNQKAWSSHVQTLETIQPAVSHAIVSMEELKESLKPVASHTTLDDIKNALGEMLPAISHMTQEVADKFAELREEANRLLSGFTPLTDQQKDLVLLFQASGMSIDKIAEKLDVGQRSIKGFMQEQDRAAQQLKELMDLESIAYNKSTSDFENMISLKVQLQNLADENTKTTRERAIEAIEKEAITLKQALWDSAAYTQEQADLIDQITAAKLEKFRQSEEGMAKYNLKTYTDMAKDAQTRLDEISNSSEINRDQMIADFEAVRDTALKAADDFRNGFIAAAEDTKKVIGETAKEIIARTLSFSEALDAARRGEGTMSATVQAGGMFTASREETIKAWAEGRYYGPVDSMGMPDFRKIGPLRGDPQESRDSGGNVSAGRSYKIGSGVEEIFTPGQSGMVVPGGGGGTTVVLNAPNGFWGADRNQVARALEDVLSARQGVTQQYTRR